MSSSLVWMDPRNSWPQPEQNCTSFHQWVRVWETHLGIRNLQIEPESPPGEEEDSTSLTLNNNHNNDMESFISLTDSNSNKLDNANNKTGVNNLNNLNAEPFHKKRRENKASTWGSIIPLINANGATLAIRCHGSPGINVMLSIHKGVWSLIFI